MLNQTEQNRRRTEILLKYLDGKVRVTAKQILLEGFQVEEDWIDRSMLTSVGRLMKNVSGWELGIDSNGRYYRACDDKKPQEYGLW